MPNDFVFTQGVSRLARSNASRWALPPVFSLSFPKGAAGEASVENKLRLGRGEEAQLFPAQNPSPQPSPRSGGEGDGAMSGRPTGHSEAKQLAPNPRIAKVEKENNQSP
jgi:hypothetical protein